MHNPTKNKCSTAPIMVKSFFLIAVVSLMNGESCFLFTKPALVQRSTSRTKLCLRNSSKYINVKNEVTPQDEMALFMPTQNNVIGRRQWFRNLGFASAMNAAAALCADQASMLSTSMANVCDETIQSYRKENKLIHIVGTAHVSSASAVLARNVVKEEKPDGVFLELDTQRVSRAFRSGVITKPIKILFFIESNPGGGGIVTLQAADILPQNMIERPGIFSGMLNKIAPNPIQQMYQAIENQGITPGEEFMAAVEEGVKNDSVIILGDRRMDITMKRIAKALIIHTDPKKLAEADRIITSKMKARMPQLEEWERQKKVLTKDEFQSFIEQMKTKESTEEFMGELKKAAPEFYNALVAERDVFMGRGMDALLSTSSINTGGRALDTIVAVIGLGHIDGVGKELRSLGWAPYKPAYC